ncbi:SRPBCC family protein [Saccharospirillum mangrovi]|uniref:SRPBCC family protein n=1 Tax=Saccharospirillum mangrovi TaxID=2161747 RepID=UPI000D3B3E0F|nr:SRPBCC family protein [Saccharospirillum mangrovi]
MKIEVSTQVNATLDAVWQAWTTPDDINQWNAASDDWCNPRSQLDLRVGGRFNYRMEARDGSAGFDFGGTFTQVQAPRLLAYRMGDDREVEVRFVADAQGVTVTEIFDAESMNPPEMQRAGWQAILDRFARHVENK